MHVDNQYDEIKGQKKVSGQTHHDVALEAKFVFEQLLHSVLILTGPASVDLVVRAHDRGDVGSDRVSKRPQVQLVQSPVVDVGAHRVPVQLLLVEQVVLGRGLDAHALLSLDGHLHGDAGEVRVDAEALPVPPTLGDLAERSRDGGQHDVDATALLLLGLELAALPHQLHVPGRRRLDARREGRDARSESDARGPVLETQLRVVDGGDGRRVADAGALVPPDPRHEADLVLLRDPGQRRVGLGVGFVPCQDCRGGAREGQDLQAGD